MTRSVDMAGSASAITHRAVEQHILLQDDTDLAAQPSRIGYGEIHAVDQDAPALRNVETLDELCDRALPRPRGSNDADRLSGRNIEGDVVQDLGSVDAIAERDVVEPDVAADRRQPGACDGIRRLGRGVEDVAQPRDRQARLVKVLPDLREPQHRRAHAPSQDVERHQLAHRQAAIDDQLRAEIENAGGDDLVDELHHLARGVAEAEHPEARGHVARKLLFPAALHLRFDRHGLERLDPGHAFDEKGLILCAEAEFLVQPLPEQRRRRCRDRNIERQRAAHDRREQRRIEEHDRQEHEGEEQIDDERERRACQEVADVLQFTHARHRIANPPRLEVGHRQSQQVMEQTRTESTSMRLVVCANR
jgi:hypothetical protein